MSDETAETAETAEVLAIERDGHTAHCARRQVWGDGCCECGAVRDEPHQGDHGV